MATKELEITTSYQLVAAGPVYITLEIGQRVKLHVAASAPLETVGAHRLVRGTSKEFLDYPGSENVYAKKIDSNKEVVIGFTEIV